MACALYAIALTTLLPAEAAAGQVALQLAWDRNPETHVVGYRLYCGTSPGTYTRSHEIGNLTTATIHDLAVDSTYYFSVVAIGDDGSLSTPSAEVSYRTPTAFAIWLKESGATGDASTDADADGIANAVEYLTGGNPALADPPSTALTCTMTAPAPGGVPSLLFRYRRATAAAADPRLSHALEVSQDGLRSWKPAGLIAGATETRTNDPNRPDTEQVEVRVPLGANPPSLFGRLRVTLASP